MVGGLAALVLLFVFGLPAIINSDSGEKPVLGVTANGVPVNPAFTDPNFYACVLDNLNSNKVEGRSNRTYGYYTTAREMAALRMLSCSGNGKPFDSRILNTNGIELLTGLQSLILAINYLSYIDVSNNTDLTILDLSRNRLTAVDVTANTELTYLNLSFNQLAAVDVTKNTALTKLELIDDGLTAVDVTKNTSLTYLDLYHNLLTSVDVTANTELTYLNLYWNKLTAVDVTNNKAMEKLNLLGNLLTAVDVTKNTALRELTVSGNQLTAVDVTKNTKLSLLNLSINKLTAVDVTKNTLLRFLNLRSNKLTAVDVTTIKGLWTLDLSKNQLTSVDVTKNTELHALGLSENPIVSIRAISSTKNIISSDQKTISTYDTDISTFLVGVIPANSIITTGVYRNGAEITSGKLLNGDKLRVSVKGNAQHGFITQYFEYQIIFLPTVLSYGNLTSSIDVAKGILYRRYLSFVSSVDVSQIKVQQGDATITSAFMAYSDGSLIRSKHAFLKNGNKLIIKLSDGTTTEFVVKTAWSW